MRRINISPPDDSWDEEDSVDEVEATLNNLENDLDETEQAVSSWSSSQSGSYSYTGTFTPSGSYTGTYTGSPSYLSLPSVLGTPHSTATSFPPPAGNSDIRLSRITERTEPSSRPVSGTSLLPRATNPVADPVRRSFLGGAISPSHSRSSTDPGSDRDLPPPGRTNELIARFETNSPGPGHYRSGSAPGGRRSPSPTKSTSSSSGSSETRPTTTFSTFLSPARPSTVASTSTYTGATPSTYTSTSNTYTTDPSRTFTTLTSSQTQTQTGTSTTPTSALRRPERTSQRYPLASVRNIVALWKERTPSRSPNKAASSVGSDSAVSPPPDPVPRDDGLFGIRRRASQRRSGESEDNGVISPEMLGELSRFVGPSETVSDLCLHHVPRTDVPEIADSSWNALLSQCPL